jgi:hypothetical protein
MVRRLSVAIVLLLLTLVALNHSALSTPTTFPVLADGATTTVVSGSLNNTTSPVTFSVSSGTGALFPSTFPYFLTVYQAASYVNPLADPNREVIEVTARTADALTATRAQLGTSNVAHTGTPTVVLLYNAQLYSDMATAINNLETAPILTTTSASNLGSGQNVGALSTSGVATIAISAGTATFATETSDTTLTALTGLTGALQAPTQVNDSNGNAVVGFGSTASAVNSVKITNNATGSGPTIAAVGSDSNINLNVAGKGTGSVSLTSPAITAGTTLHTAAKTSAYTLTAGDDVVFGNSTSASFNVTLPVASAATVGTVYRVMKTDSSGNSVTVVAGAGGTVNGTATTSTQWKTIFVIGVTSTTWTASVY